MPKPPLPPEDKKVAISVRLPPEIVAFLRSRPESQAKLIEQALRARHGKAINKR